MRNLHPSLRRALDAVLAPACLPQIREEAGELCQTLEANEGKERAASEMADLMYHSMVLLNLQVAGLAVGVGCGVNCASVPLVATCTIFWCWPLRGAAQTPHGIGVCINTLGMGRKVLLNMEVGQVHGVGEWDSSRALC